MKIKSRLYSAWTKLLAVVKKSKTIYTPPFNRSFPMARERKEVLHTDKWNVEALYPDFHDWQQEFTQANKKDGQARWQELAAYRGRLGESPETLKKGLDELLSIDRQLSKLYTYAHLRHDEEITHDDHKSGYDSISSLYHDFSQASSWFEPELLAIDSEKMNSFLTSPTLKDYRFHLEKILRIKMHTLSPDKEELLALSGKALQASQKAFRAMNDADFKFGKAIDSNGEEHELTHGSYGLYIRDQDRTLRESSFKKLHGKYGAYENTLCELLNGQVQSHIFNAKARKYSSCLEAALFPKNIDTEVYGALITAVNSELDALHDYYDLRKEMLNIGPLHLYDMYVPLTSKVDIRLPYHQAEDLVIESVKCLGSEYQNLLHKGFKEQRWVDRYENKNKRSGAYSSGCYDSSPYILMNYKDILRDVFTLAHEAGHSMHSLYTHTHQPYQYGSYPIFLAEVASTFNEDLLMRLMISRAQTVEEKIFLINEKIEDLRGTLFRQTMFAEFELLVHDLAEKDIPLTPNLLREEYRKLNSKYFGPSVNIDAEAEVEWARIPHFYYNFYVFQYATGISAALALADRVVTGGEPERQAYLQFLKSGCSLYPIDILKEAGVDMRKPEPVKAAINKFRGLVADLRSLLEGVRKA